MMRMAISSRGIGILYRCFKLPGYGKKCPDKNTDKCFKCKYCKAEMQAADATKLLNSYKRNFSNNFNEDNNENLKKS